MNSLIHDGHVHTPYCPHGTMDTLADYCEKAIELGIKGITFAEHAPLPPSFTDPTPLKDSAMNRNDLNRYFEEVQLLKKEYERFLTILLGLEVDYIEEYEEETTDFLNEVGPYLDDSILSVHFLKIDNEYVCIDYSPDVFAETVQSLGSIEKLYEHYFNTVTSSIKAELGPFKPKRIGHITLVRKFQRRFPTNYSCEDHMKEILTLMKSKDYELDYNGAGYIKPLCKEVYPYAEAIKMAINLDIPLVYGSDAHQTTALMSGSNQLVSSAILQTPQNK